jgi:hypothetical protein
MQFQYQNRKIHWIKQRNRTNKSGMIKLAINNTGTEWLSVLQKGWVVTVKYLQGLNIFVIMELTISTLFCPRVSSWGIRSRAAEFNFFLAGSLYSPAPLVTSCLNYSAVPVEFHNCNDSVTRVAGRLWVPTMRSRDILHQAKGGSSCRVPLRSDGSRDDQVGELVQ